MVQFIGITYDYVSQSQLDRDLAHSPTSLTPMCFAIPDSLTAS